MTSRVMELIERHNVKIGEDTSTNEAEARAREIIEMIDLEADRPIEIHIDRFDGMLILCDVVSPVSGFHFRSALCGYTGVGTQTAATIMKLFGFDQFTHAEVIEMINTGGDDASFSFDLLTTAAL